jgi:amidohydrolase
MTLNVFERTREIQDQLVAWRRDFHRHPELGFEETRSAGIIRKVLLDLGYNVKTGVGKTGVVGVLEGEDQEPTLMMRFDMDALPVSEQNRVEYASQVPGVMHACGHDGHMSIGLGVAVLLSQVKEQLKGTVKLVFQPAEEGLGGALAVIEDGALAYSRVDAVLGLHLVNDLNVGEISVASGPVAAANDMFQGSVLGKGGHGAIPHLARDPVLAIGQILVGLQSIVSRNVDPLETAVVSVGTLECEGAANVIPERVDFSGTIRTYHPHVQNLVHERLQELISRIAAAHQCEARVLIKTINPSIFNDPALSDLVRAAAGEIVGEEHIYELRSSASDDIAYFFQEVPGCFFFVGSKNEQKGLVHPVHNPRFDFDEEALLYGAAVMASAALQYAS